jgi:hypothetical protein
MGPSLLKLPWPFLSTCLIFQFQYLFEQSPKVWVAILLSNRGTHGPCRVKMANAARKTAPAKCSAVGFYIFNLIIISVLAQPLNTSVTSGLHSFLFALPFPLALSFSQLCAAPHPNNFESLTVPQKIKRNIQPTQVRGYVITLNHFSTRFCLTLQALGGDTDHSQPTHHLL